MRTKQLSHFLSCEWNLLPTLQAASESVPTTTTTRGWSCSTAGSGRCVVWSAYQCDEEVAWRHHRPQNKQWVSYQAFVVDSTRIFNLRAPGQAGCGKGFRLANMMSIDTSFIVTGLEGCSPWLWTLTVSRSGRFRMGMERTTARSQVFWHFNHQSLTSIELAMRQERPFFMSAGCGPSCHHPSNWSRPCRYIDVITSTCIAYEE